MGRISDWICDRYLMRTPEALEPLAVNLLWTCPSFRSSHYDHRPSRASRICRGALSGVFLDLANLEDATFERRSHQLMHRLRLIALYHVWLIAIAIEQAFQFVSRYPCEYRRVRNLIAIQMENRQYRAIANRVEEFVGMPRRCERPGFGFTIANDCDGDQFGIVEGGAVCVREAIAEFSALVDRTRRLGCAMATDAAGKRE